MMKSFFKGKRVLITGGAGFIGSNIARALADNCEIVVVDNFSSGKMENIEELPVKLFKIDITDPGLVDIMDNIDVVFHLAANVSVDDSLEDPLNDAKSNITGLLNLLEACRKRDINRVVFSSSSAVYGNDVKIPTGEDDVISPNSPYGVTKLAGEYYMYLYNNLYGMQNICLRYFNVYGPYQDSINPYSGVIAIFVDRFLRGQEIAIHGDGKQTRDFIHVSDVVKMNLLAAAYPAEFNQPVNVGTGLENSILSLMRSIDKDYKRVVFKDKRVGDTMRSASDISRARQIFSFAPEVSFANGIKSYIEWVAQNNGS